MLGFWLKALTRPTLDLTLTTAPGQQTRIIERPGAVLDDTELAALVEQLRTVAGRTLAQGALTYGVFSGERERLSQSIVTLISETATGRPIAFNALAQMPLTLNGEPEQVTHLGLVMVDPEVRGRGLSWVLYGLTVLVLFVRGGLRPRWISNVTQVPGVVGMVCETFSEVYPSPDPGSRQSFAHLSLARQIMRDHRHVFGVGPEAGFDEANSIITDAYTGGSDNLKKSFAVATKHRKPAYNDYCLAALDYGRGDDVLQIGVIDLAAGQRFLSRSVPRAALPQLAVQGLTIAIGAVVAPLIQWLDSSKPFRRLRPQP